MPIQLKRNDTKDVIGYSVTHADGTPVDLTGASVRFIMGKGKTLLTNAAATIVNATSGSVEYALSENDTLAAGVFNAEFEVTFSNGKVKTYPNNGYIKVNIEANIDKDLSTYVEDQIALRVSDIEIFKTDVNAKVAKVDEMLISVTEHGNQLAQLESGSQDNEVVIARGEYLSLHDRLNDIDNGFIVNEQSFTATEGQTSFTINGEYSVGQKQLFVDVDGVPQKPTESASNKFDFSEGLSAGQTVNARWYEGATIPKRTGHRGAHEAGGYDEIDITKLKKYDTEVSGKIADLTTNLAQKANQTDLTATDIIAKDAQTKANNPLGQIADNTLPSSKLKQATDADKIKIANLAQEVRDAMAGTTTIGTTPAPGSVTPTELANGAVTNSKLGINFNYAGVLDSTDNFDNVTNSGTYITIAKVIGKPDGINDTSLLHVMSNDSGTYCTQIIQDIDGKVVTRFKSLNYSGFTGWTPLSNLPLNGKKIVNFGDSIFGNYEAPTSVSAYIASKTGATVYNVGFGGCRMGWHNDYWDAFSMYRLADAVATGDFSRQDQAIIDGAGVLPDYFANHLAILKGIVFNGVYGITIGYGTNDWYSMDNILESEVNPYEISSYKGALRYSLEKLITAYPHLKIMVLTPIYRTLDATNNSDNYAYRGLKLTDFGQGGIDVAKEYHTHYFDGYNKLGFNKFNRNYYFPVDDGTHPNALGNQRYGEELGSALISEF